MPGSAEGEDPEVTSLIEELLDTIVKFEWLSSREDDQSAPFDSKYAARDKLIEERVRICAALGCSAEPPTSESTFPDGPPRLLGLLAIVDSLIGLNFTSTEEYHAGEMYIENGLRWFEKNPSDYTVEYLDSLNQLGAIWSNREEYDKSLGFLNKAESFYKEVAAPAIGTPQHRRIEDAYTLTAFFLAQVYSNQGNAQSSAEYCQLCLQRQLDDFEVLNLVDFACNCIGLFNFYVLSEHYTQAEYCLHAAEFVLKRADPTPRTKAYIEKEGGLPQTLAELQKTWGRFYSMLLRLGWEQLNAGSDAPPYVAKELQVVYKKLPSFTLASSALPSNFEEALSVFKKGEQALDKAKEYFLLDGWVTDHLEILSELSNMYSTLSNYESDVAGKCKMLKRKINLFEPIISELNPRVYVDTIRNLSHELATTYQEIADLKVDDKEEGHVKKINELCFKGIRFLNLLFKTFQSASTGEIEVDEPWIPLYVSGQIALARLHAKFIYYDLAQQVQQNEIALKVYEDLMAFLKKKDLDSSTFADEFRMCSEMCQLIPQKIATISGQT